MIPAEFFEEYQLYRKFSYDKFSVEPNTVDLGPVSLPPFGS